MSQQSSPAANASLVAAFSGKLNRAAEDRLVAARLTEQQARDVALTATQLKHPWIAVVLHFFLGGLGVGYFYAGKPVHGVVLLVLTLLLLGLNLLIPVVAAFLVLPYAIWLFVEFFLLFGAVKRRNGNLVVQKLNLLGA